MGTLHLCGDLVMAVSVDEHQVVPFIVLVISIHMMDFQYLKGARDLCRSLDLMKKQCVVGSTQLQNRCLLRQRIVQLPVA
jgi:hypothetical protein